MNRVLLLLLSVLTINLFGKVFPPEISKIATPYHSDKTQISKSVRTLPPLPQTQILPDTVDPEIFCPVSDTFLLAVGTCDTVLNYTVNATDDQGTAILIQLSGPASGSVFAPGVSTCVFLATDLAGNTATCSFKITVESSAAPDLICNDLFTLELDSSCARTLKFFEVLESSYGCAADFLVEVDKTIPYGNGPWLPAVFNATDIGKTYQDRVSNTKTGVKCWGNVKIVDKIGPVFNCQDIVVSCAEINLSPQFLKDSLGFATAIPQVSDACGPTTTPTYVDNSVNYFCDTPYTKIISRRWQANDQSGNSSTCMQLIKKHRHLTNELQTPPDVTLHCPDTNTTPVFTGSPFVVFNGRRYEMENNSICELSAFYEDYPLQLPCGDLRIRRLWEFFDFCTGLTDGPYLQNIYVLDETGPSIACPASLLMTLNADTCHGIVDLPDPVIDDACSKIASFQSFWEEDGLTKTLLGSLGNFVGNDTMDFDTLGLMGMALFPVGTTTVTYVAEDSCGNIGDCTFKLTIADMVPPVAHCDTFVNLQLSGNGLLTIGADFLDKGSIDACTPIAFKTKLLGNIGCQNDTLWADSLRFCCLNQNDTLDAVLRVYDIPVPTGGVSASFGNGHFSDCAVKIAITDPNPALCTPPPNITVNCENFDQTLQSYGNIASTSCAVDSMSLTVDFSQFDSVCNYGLVTRLFKVYDAAGNTGTCEQTVTVDYLQDYFTKFPDDVIVTVCDGTGIYGEPSFFGQNCENFKVDFTDEIFNIVPDACFKIERTWRIINLCTYDSIKPFIQVPNPSPSPIANHATNLPGPVVSACGTTGPWAPTQVKINPTDPNPTNFCTFFDQNANGYKYKQILKFIDGQAPTGTYTVPVCANQNWSTTNNAQLWNQIYWFDQTLNKYDLCEEPTDLSITATDACSGSNINVEYLLYLDLDGDGITESVVNSVSVGTGGLGWNNVLYNNYNTPNFTGGTPREFDERPVPANQKVGFAIEETVSGNNKTAKVRWNTQQQQNVFLAPELPPGTHKIKWYITDGCGNNKEYEYTFTVRDCRKPTVVCLGGLNVNILQSGMVTLSASDFLQYTEDNCTPVDQIKIAIRKCGTGTGFPVDGNGNPITTVTYTCAEKGNQCVEIWALDKAGNADYCEDYVIVQDNSGNCPDPANAIAGRVITELGVGIADVSIFINSGCLLCPPPSPNDITDSLGYYSIAQNIPVSADWDIIPERGDNWLNGVTTYDLVVISKHILGSEPLNSPYKMVSADANKSGSITTFDIVELRKLILGIFTVLPNNTSWRFVDSSFVFPNPLNPFQSGFPDSIPLGNPSPRNFIGMKIGDVNNTSVPSAMSPAKERFEGTVYFDSEDRLVQEAEVFEIKFNASERLEGCQLTLETNGLDILEILPGENMSKENFALFPKKSMLTMAWETGGQASFTLKMKAQKTGLLSDMLQISSEITKAEAYLSKENQVANSPISLQRIALRFGGTSSAFELFQNQPNPFAQKTAITFQLPEASSAVLTVLDGQGKVLWSKSNEWPAGMNTVEVDLSGLSAAGVLYYKLETPTKNAVRKMVRI